MPMRTCNATGPVNFATASMVAAFSARRSTRASTPWECDINAPYLIGGVGKPDSPGSTWKV